MREEKILVVDDQAANLQKLRPTLLNRYPVLAARSGAEAPGLVRANDDTDVIVADQRMPDRENEHFRKGLVRLECLARELEIDGCRMGVAYHPAREVGGDLYDF